jgi:FKBP-type peptidyl-prolyl cis-trans isomerase
MMSKILALSLALVGSAAAGTNEAGLKFLEENKGKEGVISLPSGLQVRAAVTLPRVFQ